MKRRGMRWTKSAANHLLSLQACNFCDRWLRVSEGPPKKEPVVGGHGKLHTGGHENPR